MSKIPISELLRLACIYAEQDREGFIEAYDGTPEEDVVKECVKFLEQLRKYRDNRWGKTKLEAAIEAATPMTLGEIVERNMGEE